MGIGREALVALVKTGIKAQAEIKTIQSELHELYIRLGWEAHRDGKTLDEVLELYRARWR